MGGIAFATVFAAVGQKEAQAARHYARGGPHAVDDRGLHIEVDGGLTLPVASTVLENAGPSFGLTGYFGFRAPGGPIWVQPELSVGLHQFDAGRFCVGNAAVLSCRSEAYSIGRFMVGARLGGRGFVQPWVGGHLGYGAGNGNFTGFTWDGGVGLDFHVRHWNFGAKGTFNALHAAADNGLFVKWLYIGPEVGLTF
jgi:hypothetical protein